MARYLGELETPKQPLGVAPTTLAKRDFVKPNPWCPKIDIEFDSWCDPDNPKTVTCRDVIKARNAIKEDIPMTPLLRSRCCVQFQVEMNYKLEIFHTTGSFHERGALYSLLMLTHEQQKAGVITASLGNWAMALAYHGNKLNIPVTVVLPKNTLIRIVEKCQEYGATVALYGDSLADAKRQAFIMVPEIEATYINGYDHPHVIAASGSIGIEILEQLPQTDAILVPIGGGGLIAGIAAAVKHIKPEVLIYGIEPDKCCSFFKAMENERPYQTATRYSIAGSLGVNTAGHNAFHTARSLIDKMVLVDDDWITRAQLHLVEEEKFAVEGAGATSISPLMTLPNILPELKGKTIVCVITGANMDIVTLPRSLERAKAVEGRLIKLTVTIPIEDTAMRLKILSMIANVKCNIVKCYTEQGWLSKNDLQSIHFTVVCETTGLEHACTLKRVMERLFPGICDFLEEPYSPIPICMCFPKRIL